MTEEVEGKGIAKAERVLSTGDQWPRLRLKAGDRARFHFLTSGSDDYFAASRFHKFGQGSETRTYVCLRSMSEGGDDCDYCAAGRDTDQNRFGVWVFLHFILHSGDNPDPEGEPWKQKKLDKRTLFQELFNKPMLIDLPAGRSRKWYKQFVTPWAQYGSLQMHLYELLRIGEGRDDTEYTLTAVKEMAIKKEHAASVEDLPGVEDVFKQALKFGPRSLTPAAGALGTDSLDGTGETEALPAADDVDLSVKEPEAPKDEPAKGTSTEGEEDDGLL